MKSLVKASVALTAVASLGLLLGAWTSQTKPQDAPKPAAPAQSAGGQSREEHMAAFAKAFATLKMPLTDAITIAEKARNGKAHGADVDLGKDGKLTIEVRLIVGDKFEEVYVDQNTKQVSVAEKGKGHDEDEEGEEHDEPKGH